MPADSGGSPCRASRFSTPIARYLDSRATSSAREWAAHGATFGNVVTKKQTIFGYTLHVLVTLKGIIVDCILAPAHAADVVVGDKGFMSAPLATELGQHNRLQLLTIPRRNHYQSVLPVLARLLNAQRPDH